MSAELQVVGPTDNGEFYVRLVGGNGEKMMTTHPETYTRVADAERAAEDVQAAAARAVIVRVAE